MSSAAGGGSASIPSAPRQRTSTVLFGITYRGVSPRSRAERVPGSCITHMPPPTACDASPSPSTSPGRPGMTSDDITDGNTASERCAVIEKLRKNVNKKCTENNPMVKWQPPHHATARFAAQESRAAAPTPFVYPTPTHKSDRLCCTHQTVAVHARGPPDVLECIRIIPLSAASTRHRP